MPTVSALLTNWNGPNYHGRLHALTPSDTPFTTALMGSSPGQGEAHIESRIFEWSTYDLRDAAQNTVVDGDRAGTGEHRSRSNVFNVLQTHREDVDIAYERLAQIGQYDGQNIAGGNAVTNEEAWQIAQKWKEIKRDIEFSLINGTYVAGGSGTPSQTRGILEAVSTNATDASGDGVGVATSVNTDDILDTDSAHGLSVGDDFYFESVTGGSNVSADTRYYVVSVPSTTSLTFSTTKGGSAVDFGSDITDGVIKAYGTLTEETIGDVMQGAWDNGGLQESEMGLLITNSVGARWLSKVFVKDKNLETRSRNVGGANVTEVETEFGKVGVMLNRYIPQGTIAVVSLDQCKLHHRFIPGKGVSFAEPVAKNGASNASQLYTSVGLEYGNEAAHAKITNLTVNAPTAA